MIELVFLACLRLAPDRCEERRLAYLMDVNLAVCTMNAQGYLAAWAAEHPDFTVGSWRCEEPDGRARDA